MENDCLVIASGANQIRIYLAHFHEAFIQAEIVPHRIHPTQIFATEKRVPVNQLIE